MADAERKPQHSQRGLSNDELAAEQGSDLPDREAMSLLDFGFNVEDIENLNLAVPINQAIAANINTNASIASADADQLVIVDQGLESTDEVSPEPDDRLEQQPRDRN
jgi:hypothetical protein